MSAANLRDTRRTVKQIMPDITGILTDDQLADLGRIKIALWKLEELTDVINALALDADLPLRPIPDVSLALMENDISRIAHAHQQAENRIKQAAFAAVERLAA